CRFAGGAWNCQQSGRISRERCVERSGGDASKTAMLIVVKDTERSSGASPDDQIFPTISIDIRASNAGPKLAQAPGKQRLALKIIVESLEMDMRDSFAHIRKPRRFSFIRHGRHGAIQRRVFGNFVK